MVLDEELNVVESDGGGDELVRVMKMQHQWIRKTVVKAVSLQVDMMMDQEWLLVDRQHQSEKFRLEVISISVAVAVVVEEKMMMGLMMMVLWWWSLADDYERQNMD